MFCLFSFSAYVLEWGPKLEKSPVWMYIGPVLKGGHIMIEKMNYQFARLKGKKKEFFTCVINWIRNFVISVQFQCFYLSRFLCIKFYLQEPYKSLLIHFLCCSLYISTHDHSQIIIRKLT